MGEMAEVLLRTVDRSTAESAARGRVLGALAAACDAGGARGGSICRDRRPLGITLVLRAAHICGWQHGIRTGR